MDYKQKISGAIRDALDNRGIELTWRDTDAAAAAVEEVLSDVFESAWMYEDLSDS